MRFEREAYEESIRSAARMFGRAQVEDAGYRAHVVLQFTSGSYGWMWPFRAAVERWYDAFVASL